MRPDTQIDSMLQEEARQRSSSVPSETEGERVRAAARELAADLSWLPGKPESETFAKRCQVLVVSFKRLSAGVEEAFSKARNSEDLLWLRNNIQQLSAAARGVTNELAPLTNIAIVTNKQEILPRVLAVA